MAFPTTGLLDDFNRANGLVGANWTTAVAPGSTTLSVESNACRCTTAGLGSAYWNTSYGPDMEAWGALTFLDVSLTVGFYLRASGTGATFNGYLVRNLPASGYQVLKYVNGSAVQVGGTMPGRAVSVSDKFGAAVWGGDTTTLTAYVFFAGGSFWEEMGSWTDNASPIAAAGFPGLSIQGSNWRVDDFSAGTSLDDHAVADVVWPDA